jgi:hypothetical protein
MACVGGPAYRVARARYFALWRLITVASLPESRCSDEKIVLYSEGRLCRLHESGFHRHNFQVRGSYLLRALLRTWATFKNSTAVASRRAAMTLRFVLSTAVLSYLGSNGVSANYNYGGVPGGGNGGGVPGNGGGVPGGGGGVPGGGGGGFFDLDPPDLPPSPPPPSPSPSPPSRPPPPEPPQRPPLFPGYTSVFVSVCQNECLAFANNGVCEDGGDGSSFFDCDMCAAPSPPELNPCVC